ncbi:hypothetical protein HY68_20280 [Streptomyces sp. AcH 505]|uniref:hypothetical protein n=1 Tax=Streptomyces sp. AcH 505 TaxID=352211 RepID=UPI0005919FD9|nr:hypothetical protein HY68_20280 [Streptomyces sp. AcH 505]
MEAELMALATAGATALVQQMATDGWTRVRERIAGYFAGRGSADLDSVQSDLDTSQAELALARREDDAEAAADVLADWRGRLRRTLRADPESAAELRSLLDELAGESATGGGTDVHNTISGGTQHGAVVQTGTIGSLHFGRES